MRSTVYSLAAGLSVGIASAAWGAPPAGTVYRCWDPATRKTEVSQQQFVVCKGEQTMRTPAGVVTLVNGPGEPSAAIEDPQRRARVRWAFLLSHFPDEAAHRKARDAALNPVLADIRRIEDRMKSVANERPPLIEETQFYVGKQLPPDLRLKIDANDAMMTALRQSLRAVQDDVARINSRYDVELAELREFWAPSVKRR